jgi:hypothetical protein
MVGGFPIGSRPSDPFPLPTPRRRLGPPQHTEAEVVPAQLVFTSGQSVVVDEDADEIAGMMLLKTEARIGDRFLILHTDSAGRSSRDPMRSMRVNVDHIVWYGEV